MFTFSSVIFSMLLKKDKFEVPKRGHASLSIVNPLDVLRKRLLLEIARRQMRENNRQVRGYEEIILKLKMRNYSHSLFKSYFMLSED